MYITYILIIYVYITNHKYICILYNMFPISNIFLALNISALIGYSLTEK